MLYAPEGHLYQVTLYGGYDVDAVRWGDFSNPPGIPGAQIVGFLNEPSEALVTALRRDALIAAEAECRRRAESLGQPSLLINCQWLVRPLAAGAPVLPVAPTGPAVGSLRGPAPPGASSPPALAVWRAAMSWKHIRYGDEIPGHVSSPGAIGGRDIHSVGAGEAIFVELVVPSELEEFLGRPVGADARITPIRRDRAGKREITLARAVEVMKQEKFDDWPLPGPRTTPWCLSYLIEEGVGIEAHHDRFRTVCKVQAQVWGAQEHYQLSVQLRYALLVDQLDATNLVSIELKFRRLQTIEFGHWEKAKEAEAKAVGGKLSMEEQSVFAGVTRSTTAVMVCPELIEHARAEVEREAKLFKHLRLAREEREARRKA